MGKRLDKFGRHLLVNRVVVSSSYRAVKAEDGLFNGDVVERQLSFSSIALDVEDGSFQPALEQTSDVDIRTLVGLGVYDLELAGKFAEMLKNCYIEMGTPAYIAVVNRQTVGVEDE